jgi:hypothetical protein
MRVIINQPRVDKMASRTRRLMTVGLVMLVFSVFLSTNRNTIVAAYGVMLVGLVVVNIGLAIGGKYVQNPRVDQILDKVLKGLETNSRLYSLVSPADQVVVSPAGLLTLTLKPQEGQITCRGDRWSRRWTFRLLFGALFRSRLGNPTRQAQKEAAALKKWLAARLPGTEVPIQPVIVFAHPSAELHIEQPVVPVVPLSELRAFLRQHTDHRVLDQATLKTIMELFDEQAG